MTKQTIEPQSPHGAGSAEVPQGESAEQASRGRSRLVWGLIAAVVAVGLLLAARELGGYVPRFKEWVAGLGLLGPVVFMLGYAVAVVAFIPASALTLAAGATFGLAQGTAYTFVAASVGATAAFWIARNFARHAIEARIEGDQRFAAIDRAVAAEGRKIVFLLRLSPLFPFNLLNYALGLTKVRTADYVIACFGMLPGTLLYVYTGYAGAQAVAAAAGATQDTSTLGYVLQGVGYAATLVVTILVTRIARRALQEATEAPPSG